MEKWNGSKKYYWAMAILKTSSTLKSPRKSLSFLPLSDSAQKSAWCTSGFLELVSPPQTWKKKSKPSWKAAMVPSAPAWSLRQSACLPVTRKDVLPTTQKSLVIYEYKWHCDSRFVGRTSQRLQDCIKHHDPQWLRQQLTRPRRSQPHRSCNRNNTKPDCDSAIDQHLLENDQSALNYDNKRFSILATARRSFHLNLLEAAYIKTRRPVLRRQKELAHLASCCAFSNFRYCEIFLWRALQY